MVVELRGDQIPFYKQYVSVLIILINIVVFIWQLTDPTGYMYIYEAAFIPSEFFAGQKVWTILTAMFMHADIMHIFMNMWFFYIVADNCEYALGHALYLITYLLSGLSAGLLYAFMTLLIPGMSDIPSLGASGAIFGIIAVYGILFPKNRLALLLGYSWVKMSAISFAILYFVLQIVYGLSELALGGLGGTAYFAHVGGFIAGAIIAVLFKMYSKKY